jgi:hypothetical protein
VNAKHEANFLYEWGKRRQGGWRKAMMLGAAIGAASGLLFAVLMLAASPELSLNEDEFPPFLLLLARAMGPAPFLFLISLVSFAGLGVFLAFSVWRMMEGRYHSLIASGVRPANVKPVYTLKDRAGGLIVVGVAVLVSIWLIGMLWWEINRGAL